MSTDVETDHIPVSTSHQLKRYMASIESKWDSPMWEATGMGDEKQWANYYNLMEEELIRRGDLDNHP